MSYSREIMDAFSGTLADLHAAGSPAAAAPGRETLRPELRFPAPLTADQAYLLELIETHHRQLREPAPVEARRPESVVEQEIVRFSRLRERGLTRRECEVLAWVAQGKHDAEIAAILGCAAKTVSKHVEHLLAKLGAETRLAAAHAALEWLASRA